MIDKILELSLRQRAFILLAALALVAVGLWSAIRLPIDAVPDITGVQVQINTEVRTLAAEESERFVTWPIEIQMAGLPGLQEMRSLTKFGLSQVTLQFDDRTDIYRARQLVTERLQAAMEHLPHDVAPKLAPISTGLGEIFYYSVSYKEGAKKPESLQEQLFQLREVNEYTIKPLLRTVPGVAEVNESGGYERQFVVQPRAGDLARSGMTFSELADVVAANVENAGGGIVDRGGNQLSIRAVTRANTLEDIANLPVKFAAGVKPLLVKDLADVSYGSRIRTGAATIDGQETVSGTAMLLAGENSREVAERMKARLAEIQQKLPDNIQLQAQAHERGATAGCACCQQTGRAPDVFRRCHYHHRLHPDPRPHWRRRKNVSPDGGDGDARPHRCARSRFDIDAGSLLVPAARPNWRMRQSPYPRR